MRYHKADIDELLADESFIGYCKNSNPEDVAFWENYILQNPSQQELIASAREKFILLFNVLAEADLQEQAARLRDRINRKENTPLVKMDSRVEQKHPARFPLLLKLAGAAAVLVLVVLGGWYGIRQFKPAKDSGLKMITTNYGERKKITLPDGSEINLNAGSRLQLDEGFGTINRNLSLEGEAFFDVKHDDRLPFIVHTAAMDVKALGTAFDVRAYHDEKITETSLIRGLVEVTLKEKNNQVLLLHPNQKLAWRHPSSVSRNDRSATAEDNSTNEGEGKPEMIRQTDDGETKEIAWKENKLIFENDPFSDIAVLLERWYGVRFEFSDDQVRNYRFTGRFEDEELQKVLDFLKESRHFNSKIDSAGETITIVLSK